MFFARDSSLVSIFACAPGPTPVKSITELESTQIAARAAVGLIMVHFPRILVGWELISLPLQDAAVNGAVYWETRAETRLGAHFRPVEEVAPLTLNPLCDSESIGVPQHDARNLRETTGGGAGLELDLKERNRAVALGRTSSAEGPG